MDNEPKDCRVPIMMTRSEIDAIDDWAFANRIRSRSDAIRRLVKMGLESSSAEPHPGDTKNSPTS